MSCELCGYSPRPEDMVLGKYCLKCAIVVLDSRLRYLEEHK